jgi:hypothetical protein
MANKLNDGLTRVLLGTGLALPVAAIFMEGATWWNSISLGVLFLLFVGCVARVPAVQLHSFYRFAGWVFVFAFLLNVEYESLHSVFYTHFTEPGYTAMELMVMLQLSALADGLISLGLMFAVTIFRRGRWAWPPPWDVPSVGFVCLAALGVQLTGEWVALSADRWAYSAYMPRIPGLGVGLTPALQMPLLILPTLWLARRTAR